MVTHANYVHKPNDSKPRKPITVPNQTLSIRTILDRYRRGQSVETFDSGYNAELPAGLEYMDKIERIELSRQTARDISRQRQALLDQQEKQRLEKLRLASQQPPTNPGTGDGSGTSGQPDGDSAPK